MTTIDLDYFNAGGGHRASVAALETVMREHYPGWTVRPINLFEMLDPHDVFRRISGMAPEDLYNKQLELGLTAGIALQNRMLHATLRLAGGVLQRRLERQWQQRQPDMVVSLIPHINLIMHNSLRGPLPRVPFVTVLTDMADYPPNFWMAPGTAQHVICGTVRACEQAHAMGLPDAQIHRTSGMIVRPDFYGPPPEDPRQGRIELGLDPARATGIVMFGGHGSRAMLEIARQLSDQQLILMTGRNQALARTLRAQTSGARHLVVEFTPQVREYMQLADYFIGKPGPGSLSEAVQQRLPVITICNSWTMPQERYNADWITTGGLGLVVRSAREIRPAVLELLSGIEDFRSNVESVENRAVFEVPAILEQILGAC